MAFREMFLFCVMGMCGMASGLQAGEFPAPNDTQPLIIPFPPAAESLAKLHLPEGFKATVFASEPDVNNPIACCWDEKGRLWVVENFTYGDGSERYNLKLRDRILIFEDTDNDGVHDRRTVFTDQLQMLTSVERGFGGVWAMSPPHLLFIPDADGDDVPDGPPQVMLEGFSTEASQRHTFANGLKWGPDGWLYGRVGITSTSFVGVPGSKPEERLGTAGGLWRYHPTRKVFDIVSAGTTNPWGHDWNRQGELFFINTVIGHLWHGIHGAHFKRMHGQDLNPRVYQQMEQMADHYHWDTGGSWRDTREGGKGIAAADSLGGGHAHVGMMIYQGTNWPARYRDQLFTLNLHGRRVNVERLEPLGSGYVGRHEPDILKSDDPWFRGVEITYGPDGGVYILDWSDLGECHENDGVHRNSGRIYKITFGEAVKPSETAMATLPDETLVQLQLSENEWLVRMARWELRERGHRRQDTGGVEALLAKTAAENSDSSASLPLLWTRMFVNQGSAPPETLVLSTNPDLQLPSLHWLGDALLLTGGKGKTTPILPDSTSRQLQAWAGDQGSPSLRRGLASFAIKNPAWALSLMPPLLAHAGDAGDANLPLMYWYAIMDLPSTRLAPLFASCRIPLVRKFIARRCAEDIESDPAALNQLLALGAHQADVLAGLGEALDGWAKARKPERWEDFVATLDADPSLRERAQAVNILFGDGRALADIKKIVLDENADLARRDGALQSLITARAGGLKAICQQVLMTHGLSSTALRGLAMFDDGEIGPQLAQSYPSFYPHEQHILIDTLITRKNFAKALLDAMAAGSIPKTALTIIQARHIRAMNDAALVQQLAEVWGEIRDSSADKQALIAALKTKLTPEVLAKADLPTGRVLFNQSCAVCHKLYGEGNLIGPDLTGSGRRDINYLIGNIVDPNALLAADYRMTIVTMNDGRVLSGNIANRTEHTLTLKMVGTEQTLPLSEMKDTRQLPVSLMPEGLLQAFTDEQKRDLMAYLMTESQVKVP